MDWLSVIDPQGTKAGNDQYLRTTNIPLLKYKVNGKTVEFNYERVVKGFAMPIRVAINGKEVVIKPSDLKQTFEFSEDIKHLRSIETSTLRQRKCDLHQPAVAMVSRSLRSQSH